MALGDLDLVFEEEDESTKKKDDKVGPDVTLEFNLNETKTNLRLAEEAKQQAAAAAKPAAPPVPKPQAPTAAKPAAPATNQVKKIDEARAAVAAPAQAVKRPQAAVSVSHHTSGSSAIKIAPGPIPEENFGDQSQEIIELRERARQAEFNAEVKVQVAEFKTEILGELLGDIKLMDHQVNQLLMRIHAKHPDMKQEVLLIKKILADFSAKKRR